MSGIRWQPVAALLRFFGPVAGAVKGELSKEERVRALGKAFLVGTATKGALWASLRQPDTITDLIAPVVAAALAGLLDALSRYQQGDAPNPPGPDTAVAQEPN